MIDLFVPDSWYVKRNIIQVIQLCTNRTVNLCRFYARYFKVLVGSANQHVSLNHS